MGLKKSIDTKKIIRKTFALIPKKLENKTFDPAEPMVISGVANMAQEDRMRDVVLNNAWILENYLNNPVILFNHSYDNLVGKAISIEATDLGLEVQAEIGNPLSGYELTEKQEEIRSLLAQGILKAFSVGFIPLDAEYDEENDRFVITKAELLEISLVSVPCQQDSLISEIKSFKEKGVNKMDEEMKTLLTAIAEGVQKCNDKINSIYDKLEGKGGKPNEEPQKPIEESIRLENLKLKQENEGLSKVIEEFSKLV